MPGACPLSYIYDRAEQDVAAVVVPMLAADCGEISSCSFLNAVDQLLGGVGPAGVRLFHPARNARCSILIPDVWFKSCASVASAQSLRKIGQELRKRVGQRQLSFLRELQDHAPIVNCFGDSSPAGTRLPARSAASPECRPNPAPTHRRPCRHRRRSPLVPGPSARIGPSLEVSVRIRCEIRRNRRGSAPMQASRRSPIANAARPAPKRHTHRFSPAVLAVSFVSYELRVKHPLRPSGHFRRFAPYIRAPCTFSTRQRFT